jgi:hypothetical protein
VNLCLDNYYGYSFNQPRDDTIIGSSAVSRNTEWQINNATIGVDTNYKNVLGKLTLLETGNQLAVTQDLHDTVNCGRNLGDANNKYIGEAREPSCRGRVSRESEGVVSAALYDLVGAAAD